jgi:hypothetical protein
MESSNQETENGTNSRQQTIEEEIIRKTTAKTRTRKLIKKFRKEEQQRKLPSHRNIRKPMKRKRCHCLDFTICLSYSNSFLQLLDLQEKEDKNSNKASRENIAYGT